MISNRSYFSFGAISQPLRLLDRWLHPYSITTSCEWNGNTVRIAMTRRALRALQQRERVLVVEMQLYFSCVVKKRVIFHERPGQLQVVRVKPNLAIAFHCMQSDICNPEEFASTHPGKKILDAAPALKMRPRELCMDFYQGSWQGSFTV